MINTHVLGNAVRSFASSWIYPRDTHGNPDGMVHFYPAGEGSCLVLETTSLDHGDVPSGYVRGSGTSEVKSASMIDV